MALITLLGKTNVQGSIQISLRTDMSCFVLSLSLSLSVCLCLSHLSLFLNLNLPLRSTSKLFSSGKLPLT